MACLGAARHRPGPRPMQSICQNMHMQDSMLKRLCTTPSSIELAPTSMYAMTQDRTRVAMMDEFVFWISQTPGLGYADVLTL